MGYGVPIWLEILVSANTLVKLFHSSLNVILCLYLQSDLLVREWPVCVTMFYKSNNTDSTHDTLRIEHSEIMFNVSAIMLSTVMNNNGQNINTAEQECQFQVRKYGPEYV